METNVSLVQNTNILKIDFETIMGDIKEKYPVLFGTVIN